jgi:hypothetical protein
MELQYNFYARLDWGRRDAEEERVTLYRNGAAGSMFSQNPKLPPMA